MASKMKGRSASLCAFSRIASDGLLSAYKQLPWMAPKTYSLEPKDFISALSPFPRS